MTDPVRISLFVSMRRKRVSLFWPRLVNQARAGVMRWRYSREAQVEAGEQGRPGKRQTEGRGVEGGVSRQRLREL